MRQLSNKDVDEDEGDSVNVNVNNSARIRNKEYTSPKKSKSPSKKGLENSPQRRHLEKALRHQ